MKVSKYLDNFIKVLNVYKEEASIFDMAHFISDCNIKYKQAKAAINNKSFFFPKILPVITSKNETGREIQHRLKFDFEQGELLECCIFINKDQMANFDPKNKNLKIFLAQLPANLGDSNNKICVGCFILFKKNFKNFNVYNGKSGFLTHIFWQDDFVSHEIFSMEINNNVEKKICGYSGKLPLLRFVSNDVMFNFEAHKETIKMKENNLLCLDIYYIQPFYSKTLYGLQGSTISKIDTFNSTEDIIDRDHIRCFYVLVSRSVSPKCIKLCPKTIEKFQKSYIAF